MLQDLAGGNSKKLMMQGQREVSRLNEDKMHHTMNVIHEDQWKLKFYTSTGRPFHV